MIDFDTAVILCALPFVAVPVACFGCWLWETFAS